MKRDPIKSSNIKEMGYDQEAEILEITFKSGGTYSYSKVTRQDIEALKSAPSFGHKFHELKKARNWDFKKLG